MRALPEDGLRRTGFVLRPQDQRSREAGHEYAPSRLHVGEFIIEV
jgi:hypothetical protein